MSSLDLRFATKTGRISDSKGSRIDSVIRIYSGSGVTGQICFLWRGCQLWIPEVRRGYGLINHPFFLLLASKSLDIGRFKQSEEESGMRPGVRCATFIFCSEG